MKNVLAFMVSLSLIAGVAEAKDINKRQLMMVEGGRGLLDDISTQPTFSVAQAGTTWWGWSASGSGPHSVGAPGLWDFDDRGVQSCPVHDFTDDSPIYIKNGAYAQGWTSEDVYAQIGLYWHADDFTAVPGASPINGLYSGWCGVSAPDPPNLCFTDTPGYGHNWDQWLCRTVTMDEVAPSLGYSYRHDSEPGFDYTYVFIDSEFPDSCGWVGRYSDTLRCYDGTGIGTEAIDLTSWDGGTDCDNVAFHTDYSGFLVKICFVGVSDRVWDDQDGLYDTADGMFVVDDVLINVSAGSGDTVLTTFETGTLEGWTRCGGWSPGDWIAIRDRSDFINHDMCGFDNCDISGCVLAFYNDNIAGQYGNGGHYAGDFHKRAWSPPVDLTGEGERGYLINTDRYLDLPIPNWIFYRYWGRYWQDPDCPAGAVSPAVSDNYVIYYPYPGCSQASWGFSQYVPTDADSVQIGLSAWAGCDVWDMPCTNGNETPIFDNVRLGTYSLSAPQAWIRAVDNYTDSWPEDDLLTTGATALIDAANNKSQTGAFLRMADSAVISLDAPNVQAELCFRIEPGPGTSLTDPFFATKYVDGDGWNACELSTDMFCTRMDTAFAAGDGDTTSAYEFQKVFEGYYATMVHEDDVLYAGEGEEIWPDSLFTAGTKIYYAFRTKFVGGTDVNWLPFGADLVNDPEGTAFEVMVLPDLCKDPVACLLYVDYYNRGAQEPIEEALALLGREWDRFDLRAESSHQANGIGNRLLGPGRYRLARGPIGPSFSHLSQYTVMLVNSGNFDAGTCFSDGGTGTPDDPSNDVTFMDNWLNEGRYKGLWLSGNSIASDFAAATSGPKPSFLSRELATDLVSNSYVSWSGHDVRDNCRALVTRTGTGKVINTYSVNDSLRVFGSGCPYIYNYDVIVERDAENGIEFVSMMYDLSGGYASVDHVFTAANAPFDSVRTKIDGFSLHNLRPTSPPCADDPDRIAIALWIRDVLGGNRNDGYFYDRLGAFQYCPPQGSESTLLDVPRGGRTYANALFQNYPNPFRSGSGTTIHYTAARAGRAEILVFDAAGRWVIKIVDQAEPGANYITWNGRDESGRRMSSGVYFYRIRMGGFTSHKKMLLVD